MGKRKEIRCICHSPFAVWSTVEEPWSDVWVRWKTRPGRPTERYAPTLIARSDLEDELARTPAGTEHEQLAALLRRLTTDGQEYDGDARERLPNLYTHAPQLTRAVAEQLLTAWLADVHGIINPKFHWQKPKIFIR